jgi:hypothetical protein
MSLTETQIESFECCVFEKISDVAAYSSEGRLTGDMLGKAGLFYYQTKFIRQYIPNGSLLVEGFISEATLDFGSFTAFGVLLGNIVVDGASIAFLPEATYADLAALVTGVVTAINTSGSGYTADNGGDPSLGIVVLHAPGAGTEANGFIVSVVINPFYQLQDTVTLDTTQSYQMVSVNDTASAFYGKTFVSVIKPPTSGTLSNYWVYVVENNIVTNQIYLPNGPGQFAGIGSWSLVHDPVNDRIYVAGYFPLGKYSYIDTSLNLVLIPGTATPPINFTNEASVFFGATYAIYNPVNSCKYFISYGSATYNIRKLSSTDVQTTIGVGVATIPQNLAVDPASGNVWVQTPTAVHIFNVADALVLTITNVGQVCTDITYCADTNRMLVAYKTPGIIKSFLMNGTIDVNPWYDFGGATAQCTVFYSTIYNVVFVSDGLDTSVLSTAGVLKNTITGEPSTEYTESVKDQKVISNFITFGAENLTKLRFFNLGNSGEALISGAMEGGTPDVFQTEADQCVEEKYVNQLIEHLKRECGCEDCGGDNSNGSVLPPPVFPTVEIYYGTSALTTLTNTQVEVLTTLTAVTYAGSYDYTLVAPDQFEYIAWPASLGTPSRFYDPSTGFDIAMNTTYQVTINSITYNVARTYYAHGGGYTLTLTA